MPIEHKTIKMSSKLNEYRSNSINRRVSYATNHNNNDNTPEVIKHTDRSDNDNRRVKQTKTIVSPTAPNGLNATFFDANTPYCWYVVNAPPCYDIKAGTVIR